MRCLVVADLHYSLPQFDWLLAAAPQFDVVIFAGDALDIGSMVDFRAQILVVKKYLTLLSGITRVILCSGNHDLDERSRGGRKNLALGRRRARTRHCLRRRQPHDIETRSSRCAHGGTDRWSRAASKPSFATPRHNDCSNGSGCIMRRRRIHPTSWGGKRFFGDVELVQWIKRLPAVDGDLGSRASVALHPRRLLVRPARYHLGIQHRPAAWPPTGLHRARPRSGGGLLASGRRRAMHRPARAIAAAGNAYTGSAALAHILGSDCRWHAPCRQIAAGGLHCPDLAQRPQALFGLGRCLPSADLN